jgi:hypothetical protein
MTYPVKYPFKSVSFISMIVVQYKVLRVPLSKNMTNLCIPYTNTPIEELCWSRGSVDKRAH